MVNVERPDRRSWRQSVTFPALTRLAVAAVILIPASGCDRLLTQPDPLPAVRGAVPMTPPSSYAKWYAETEACSGLTGRFDRLRWWTAPGRSFQLETGPQADGLWDASGNIVIASALIHDQHLVRHEMLHDLIGEPGHPAHYFRDRCKGLVRP